MPSACRSQARINAECDILTYTTCRTPTPIVRGLKGCATPLVRGLRRTGYLAGGGAMGYLALGAACLTAAAALIGFVPVAAVAAAATCVAVAASK